jgi:DNA-binding MarR family transcriptional regulator
MRLEREILQQKPFPGVQDEAILSVVRTADQLMTPMNDLLRNAGLSHSQYNILRILRGSAPAGLSCGEIAERMIRRDPDLTRLLDRLEKRGLVARARGTTDRRVVLSVITPAGLELLASLDEPVSRLNRDILAHVPEEKLRTLVAILDEIRDAGA